MTSERADSVANETSSKTSGKRRLISVDSDEKPEDDRNGQRRSTKVTDDRRPPICQEQDSHDVI